MDKKFLEQCLLKGMLVSDIEKTMPSYLASQILSSPSLRLQFSVIVNFGMVFVGKKKN